MFRGKINYKILGGACLAAQVFIANAPCRADVSIDKKSLSLEGAKKIAAAAESAVKEKGAPGGVVAVVDDGGNLVYLERLDGTFSAGATVSVGKAKTAATFKKPTSFFENAIKNGRVAFTTVHDATPLQGGIPIELNGQIIGGVGVSGASSAAQDEEIAIEAAKAVKGDFIPTPANAVSYFRHDQVQDSFNRGGVLLNNGGYQVHTSRRDAAGKAEVHTLDTDVIYVLAGKATFVTGGTVVDGKTVEANEIRGESIDGGETRELTPGDVVVVPHGTPHWFKQVDAPFTYLAVKAQG